MSGFVINPYVFADGGGGEVGIEEVGSFDGTGSNDAQLGWEFEPSQDINVTSLRVYFEANSNETLRLWRVSDQALLASEDVAAVAGEWVEASLASPVSLTSGAKYLITTREQNAATRDWWYFEEATLTFNAAISITGSVASSTDAYPGSFAPSPLRAYGASDVGFEAA